MGAALQYIIYIIEHYNILDVYGVLLLLLLYVYVFTMV